MVEPFHGVSMPNLDGPSRKPLLLSIDWGSSSIRASLLVKTKTSEDRKAFPVVNPNIFPGHDKGYQTGAFNNTFYIDSKDAVFLGETMDEHREPHASKMYFTKDGRPDNKLIQRAIKKRTPEIEGSILEALKQILIPVLEAVQNICDSPIGKIDWEWKRTDLYYVDEIILSCPDRWTSAECDVYEDVLKAVIPRFPAFGRVGDNVSFIDEILAFAHYVFANPGYLEELLRHSSFEKPPKILFLDFGGHAMSGCTFSVVRHGEKNVSYFKVGPTFSSEGGTQVWEHEVKKFAGGRAQSSWGSQHGLSPRQQSELLNWFHDKIKGLRHGVEWDSKAFTTADEKVGGKILSITLNKDDLEKTFRDAMNEPIALACDKIVQASRLCDKIEVGGCLKSNLTVVLCGGSGKNPMVRVRLRKACEDAGIIGGLHVFDGLQDSWMTSKGAAVAGGSPMSVKTFLEEGAAFAFQKGSKPAQRTSENRTREGYGGDDDYAWEEQAEVALDDAGSHKVPKQFFSGSDRLRIICSPFLQPPPNAETELKRWDSVNFDRSYDVINLPNPERGHWIPSLAFVSEGEEGALSITMKKMYKQRQYWKVCKKVRYKPVPLYFDIGSRCVLPKTDADDTGRGLELAESGEISGWNWTPLLREPAQQAPAAPQPPTDQQPTTNQQLPINHQPPSREGSVERRTGDASKPSLSVSPAAHQSVPGFKPIHRRPELSPGARATNISRPKKGLRDTQSHTLQQFLERGAAFGIQELQETNYEQGTWDSQAKMILASQASGWSKDWEVVFNSNGMSRFKIICDPFWNSETDADGDNNIPYVAACKSYDVLDLLIVEAGTWRVRLSPMGDITSNLLLLERAWSPPGILGPRPRRRDVLELYYAGASKGFLVRTGGDVHDSHYGVGLDEEGRFVALTPSLENGLREKFWRREVAYKYPGIVDSD